LPGVKWMRCNTSIILFTFVILKAFVSLILRKSVIWNLWKRPVAARFLASTKSKFKIALAYPDKVTICGKVSSIESDRFVMDYCVVSHKHQKIAAEGEGLIVSFDYKAAKKTPIPEEIRQQILDLEGL